LEGFQADGFVANTEDPLFTTLAASFNAATGRDATLGPLTCTTDARFFHKFYNTPACCLGPLAEHIHGIDERVSIKSIMEVAATYALFIAKFQGLSKI
jgi:acetylornithine deacetylase